jgi:two-component system response regulator VicR
MKNILLVEDNYTIIMGLKYSLEQENFKVISAQNVSEFNGKIDKNDIDLVLLDVSLPDGNGFEICKEIKSKKDIPVIFLTAQDEETSVVLGLDLGADDYIVKPFRTRELISRINSVLRRYGHNESNLIQYKNIKIDTSSAKVYKDNEEIIFTSLEYKILLMLFSNQNKLISREQLLEKIWDIAGNFVNDNTLTVYIKRIREKLGDEIIIKTVRGLGYRIGE